MKQTQKERASSEREASMLKGLTKNLPINEKPFNFSDFEFKTIEDFETYNNEVRKHNMNCLHERNKMKIKVPDESYHKKVKVKFQRFDQPENVLKVKVRNKSIDWEGQLKAGGTYELAVPVVKFLNNLAEPIFAEVKCEHGDATHTETKQVGERSRFSCNVVDFD